MALARAPTFHCAKAIGGPVDPTRRGRLTSLHPAPMQLDLAQEPVVSEQGWLRQRSCSPARTPANELSTWWMRMILSCPTSTWASSASAAARSISSIERGSHFERRGLSDVSDERLMRNVPDRRCNGKHAHSSKQASQSKKDITTIHGTHSNYSTKTIFRGDAGHGVNGTKTALLPLTQPSRDE